MLHPLDARHLVLQVCASGRRGAERPSIRRSRLVVDARSWPPADSSRPRAGRGTVGFSTEPTRRDSGRRSASLGGRRDGQWSQLHVAGPGARNREYSCKKTTRSAGADHRAASIRTVPALGVRKPATCSAAWLAAAHGTRMHTSSRSARRGRPRPAPARPRRTTWRRVDLDLGRRRPHHAGAPASQTALQQPH